jgi:hypothetical protein
MLFAKYNLNDPVKKDVSGRACSMNDRDGNAYRESVEREH